jgi:uncharacterized membrane protein YjjP (DUF1212 family)
LEAVAMIALDAGRMLMEAGASAKSTEQLVTRFATGLGAERVELRIGYASLAITIGIGAAGITRMRKIGALGVDQRLDQALRGLAERVARQEFTVSQTRAELTRLAAGQQRHPAWVVALAVGLACAAFGRLLAADWLAIGPVFLAAGLGQFLRRELLRRHVNHFFCATLVALLGALLGGAGAQWLGSETVMTAMLASILFLVPGVPAVNAQTDILEGHPTLGSARAVSVVMTLIFMAAGLWFAQLLVNLSP